MKAPLKIGIIGVGLIGGSLSLALKKSWPQCRIVGYHDDINHLKQALKLHVIDDATDDLGKLCDNADFIFVCLPISLIIPVIKRLKPLLDDKTIVTDVGSAKGTIVRQAEEILADSSSFIGGHPMAGSEQRGVIAASASLFHGAVYVLTPTDKTSPSAFERLHGLLNNIGARLIALSPDKHDSIVANVSHLPHILAAALINTAADSTKEKDDILLFAAGSFRDMTRIAASNPDLWVDISVANKEALLKALNKYIAKLKMIAGILNDDDTDRLRDELSTAGKLRQSLSLAQVTAVRLQELEIPVTDSPGVISRISLAFGRHGINIEDIQIFHTGKKSGIIRVMVSDSPSLDKAIVDLHKAGFTGIKKGLKL